MNFPFYIARRYFFSKNSSNAVNIITGISMLGMLVGTASLIIVLSAFNGLENLVKGFYNSFDPELKVLPVEGKYFELSGVEEESLKSLENIRAISLVLEERALFGFRDKEYIATLKGVDQHYTSVTAIDSGIYQGSYELFTDNGVASCIMGAGVAYYLGFNRLDSESSVRAFIPKAGNISLSNPDRAFTSKLFYPSGIFSIQPEFDEKYVITSLAAVQELTGHKKEYTAIELALSNPSLLKATQKKVKELLGSQYKVLNRDEQQAVFFKVMNTEGLFTFLVFALILAIATFTVMGSLTMLILDKKENLRAIWAMGSDLQQLRKIFFYEGLLISGIGALAGLALGVAVVFIQDQFQLITLGAGYAVEAYPVELQFKDIGIVLLTVLVLSSLTSYLTSQRLSPNLLSRI